MIVPALYETADGQTADGKVRPFCTEACLNEWKRHQRGAHFITGETHTEPFGFIPQCEQCGRALRPCDFSNWGHPCILVAKHDGDHERSIENSMRGYP